MFEAVALKTQSQAPIALYRGFDWERTNGTNSSSWFRTNRKKCGVSSSVGKRSLLSSPPQNHSCQLTS